MNPENYLNMLWNIMTNGRVISPRGMEIREIEDLHLIVGPDYPFMTFEDRKYDVNYFKHEMKWKLGANKYDVSIQNHAKMWSNVINPDNTYNSNYGQYWFGEQAGIWHVVTELVRDPDSRRAVIPMLNASHLAPHVKDTVCTEAVGFRLRSLVGQLELNMSVHMRSSDVIFGLGTDIPTFAFLYRLVLGLISESISVPIKSGFIVITSMSSHIYSRHYEMANKIIKKGVQSYTRTSMPYCNNYAQALKIIASRGNEDLLQEAGNLGRWLCE